MKLQKTITMIKNDLKTNQCEKPVFHKKIQFILLHQKTNVFLIIRFFQTDFKANHSFIFRLG